MPDKACAASERRACRPGWDRLPVTPAPWPPRWRPHYATHPRATMPTDPGPKEPPTSSRLRSSSPASPDHGQDPPHAQVERASPAPETTPLSPHDHPVLPQPPCAGQQSVVCPGSPPPLGRSDPAPAAAPARVPRRPVRPHEAAWRCSSHKKRTAEADQNWTTRPCATALCSIGGVAGCVSLGTLGPGVLPRTPVGRCTQRRQLWPACAPSAPCPRDRPQPPSAHSPTVTTLTPLRPPLPRLPPSPPSPPLPLGAGEGMGVRGAYGRGGWGEGDKGRRGAGARGPAEERPGMRGALRERGGGKGGPGGERSL